MTLPGMVFGPPRLMSMRKAGQRKCVFLIHSFGFNKKSSMYGASIFRRTIARKNETDYLVIRSKTDNAFVSHFAEMSGISQIKPQRRIEIIPYATSKAEFTHPDAGNPFNDGSSYDPGMGADMKFGFGTNLKPGCHRESRFRPGGSRSGCHQLE